MTSGTFQGGYTAVFIAYRRFSKGGRRVLCLQEQPGENTDVVVCTSSATCSASLSHMISEYSLFRAANIGMLIRRLLIYIFETSFKALFSTSRISNGMCVGIVMMSHPLFKV